MNGFIPMATFRVARIDLGTEKVTEEVFKDDVLRRFLGGRGLGSYLALKEIPRGIDPLSPSNRLYIFAGPLSAMVNLSTSRVTVVTKSPLTGSLTHANAGGNFAYWLRKSGYDGIIIEGAAEDPVYVVVKDGDVAIRPAGHLWGKWTGASIKAILRENGFPEEEKAAGVAVVGPAGENLSRIAGIRMSDYERFAGRGGVGAVMGSKRLKGILVWGTRDLLKDVKDRAKFIAESTKLAQRLMSGPTAKALHIYGTNLLTAVINSIGAYPIRNFETAYAEEADKLTGEYIKKNYVVETHACMMCPIACTQHVMVKAGPYKFVGKAKYEYENTWTLGANLGLFDPEADLRLQKLANELGFDTISLGNTLATAIELAKKGKLKLDVNWGDAGALIDLVIRTANRSDVGDDLAEGDYRLALKYGDPSAFRGSRGQGLPAYDPRGLKGFALSYFTANRGGDHLEAYSPTWEVLGVPEKVDPLCETPECIEKQARIVVYAQHLMALTDSVTYCKFATLDREGIFEKDLAHLFNMAYDWDVTPEEMLTIGERIFNVERLFHVKEGKWVKDELNPHFRNPIPTGPAKGHSSAKMFDEGIKIYYKLRGWVDGKPTYDTLKRLGLEEFQYLL
jgi:aldehyde:ferredoxin oxidoreductase